MKKLILAGLAAILGLGFFSQAVFAQVEEQPLPEEFQNLELPNLPDDEFYRARVMEIVEQSETYLGPYQQVKVEILNGQEKGQTQTINYGDNVSLQPTQLLKAGDEVLVVKIYDMQGAQYFVADVFRLKPVIYMLAGFVALVLLFGRWKGLTSLLGLGLTIVILGFYIVPQILAGANPLLTIMIGSVAILFLSLYLAHGFNRRTSIALGSTVITLGLAMAMAFLAVSWARLSGLGSEEAYFLQVGALQSISLRGLLLGGIIIGTLGVLDDITTGQSAVIAELKSANPGLSFKELYFRGLNVGREHIASLVNTLVLAYAGASFPLLLILTQNQVTPIWFTLNNEFFIEEVIRTLVGSSALILAVPITTFIAAYFWSKKSPVKEDVEQFHVH